MSLSRVGATLAGAYVLFALGVVIYAYLCAGNYCGLIALLPALPWLPLLEEGLDLDLPQAAYPVLLLLNAVLLYWLGAGLGKLLTKLASLYTYGTKGG